MNRTTTQINLQLRDILRENDWYDPDNYSVRLAENIQQELHRGRPLEKAVAAAIGGTETGFFRANKKARGRLVAELTPRLGRLALAEPRTLDTLLGFKSFAQRQLVPDLKRDPTEAPTRAFLQTWLERSGRTYREVEAGGGREDILLLIEESREVIEVKVWRGRAYHEDGLAELGRYLAAEGLARGFSVVFEFFETDPVTPGRETRVAEGVVIEVIFVHVPLTPPSKVGRARRSNR